MFTPLREMARDPEGKVLLASAATTIAVGTVVYSVLEGWSPIDSLYFSVVTLATVGFGDLHPTTEIARLFTVGYILLGIGILAAFASELTKFRQPVGLMSREAPPGTRRGARHRARRPAGRSGPGALNPSPPPAGIAERRATQRHRDVRPTRDRPR